jgi:hypothetical protein
MKRILLSIIMAFGLMSSPTPLANAVTEGCPDTWKIDTTISGGWAELLKAKSRIGSNMVLGFDEYSMIYSDYAGEVGSTPKPTVNLLGAPDLYIYGNTKVAFKVTVQVKNCPGKTDFLLQGGSLKEYLGLKANPAFIQTSAKDFAISKSDLFVDFVKAQEFPACIASLIKAITSNASRMGVWSYQYISPAFLLSNSAFCGLRTGFNSANPILLNLTPECSAIYSEPNEIPRRTGILVKSNKSCEFAFAFADRLTHRTEAFLGVVNGINETQNPIYVLESFKVSGPVVKNASITCVKGKQIKNVIGVKPKCPSGYKLKR